MPEKTLLLRFSTKKQVLIHTHDSSNITAIAMSIKPNIAMPFFDYIINNFRVGNVPDPKHIYTVYLNTKSALSAKSRT